MFEELAEVFKKPKAFEYANSTELWNNPHISKQMLKLHLDPDNDPASRNRKFMDKSINWIFYMNGKKNELCLYAAGPSPLRCRKEGWALIVCSCILLVNRKFGPENGSRYLSPRPTPDSLNEPRYPSLRLIFPDRP